MADFFQQQGTPEPSVPPAPTDVGITTESGYDEATQERYRFPFNLYRIRSNQMGVHPGALNELFPTIGGQGIDDTDNPPELTAPLGRSYVYLIPSVDADPASSTFGQLLGAEIQISATAVTTPTTFANPRLRLAWIDTTGGPGAYQLAINNEVFGSLQLIQFYDQFIFMPYFAVPEQTLTNPTPDPT